MFEILSLDIYGSPIPVLDAEVLDDSTSIIRTPVVYEPIGVFIASVRIRNYLERPFIGARYPYRNGAKLL